MNPIKVVASVLIIAGVLALAYGGSFSYSRTTPVATVGPISINAEHKHTVNIPVWAGVGGIVIGVLLFAFGGKRE